MSKVVEENKLNKLKITKKRLALESNFYWKFILKK